MAIAGQAQQKGESKSYVLRARTDVRWEEQCGNFAGRSDCYGWQIVGVGSNAAVPAGAQVVDLGDATLLPGFI